MHAARQESKAGALWTEMLGRARDRARPAGLKYQ